MITHSTIAIIQFGGFVFLVAFCIRVAVTRTPEKRRRRILELIAYVVVAHLVIGVTQKDAWPITNYRLMHGRANLDGELSLFTFYGVDQAGREWRIDPYAWRSISDWHLHFWFWITYARKLPPAQQQEALAWLFGLAESDRARLAAGHTSISALGPLSAPQWLLYQRQLQVPQQPYRAFRVYLETFTVADAIAESKQPDRAVRDHLVRKFMGEWKPR